MRGKLLIAALATIAVTGFVSAPGRATTLFDNITAHNSDGNDQLNPTGPLYDSFSTGTKSYFLTEVDLLLGRSGTFNVGLYANQIPVGGPFSGSSIPGSLITNLGTFSAPAVSGVVAVNGENVVLAANTRYWIGLSSSSTTIWFFSLDFSGTGVGSEFNFIASVPEQLPNNPDGAYQMRISGQETPLPAALPLFASGGGVLGLLSWRRKRKAQAATA